MLATLRAENHPDFRTLVADRIQKHYFNGGLMTPGPATERLLQRTTQIERAFLAEAARWNYRTPSSWENARDNYISNILSNLDQTVIAMFEGAGLLPATAAPEFSQHGGEVAADYSLSLSTSTSGTIFYTTDGSDPRLSGGAISSDATSYSAELTVHKNTFVRARTKNGNEWSGLTEAFFTIEGVDSLTADDIAISELHYHPADGSSNTEFLEILNTGDRPVNLRNTRFTAGVLYDFPTVRDLILNPGERIVLVESLYHMNLAYGLGLPVAGIYEGALDNDGELIRFEEMDGTEIAELAYNDSGSWPTSPDGSGVSLTLNEQFADFDESSPLFWRSSFVTGGTPGTIDSSGVTFPGGNDEDLLNYAYGNDGIREHAEPSFHLFNFGNDRHGVLTFRANMQTEDLLMHFEHSENLIDWFSGPGETELLGRIDNPDGTSQLTFRSLTPASTTSPATFLRVRFELR